MTVREWPISYWHYVPGPSSPIQMMRGAMKVMDCGGVKPNETVLISTDSNKLRIAEALAGAAYAVGATPIIMMIPPVGVHGAQLPEPVVAAFREADVFLQRPIQIRRAEGSGLREKRESSRTRCAGRERRVEPEQIGDRGEVLVHRVAQVRLVERERAVGGDAGCKHHLCDASFLGRLQHVPGSHDVDTEVALRGRRHAEVDQSAGVAAGGS